MVVDIKPIPDIPSAAIYRQRLVSNAVKNHDRDKFFGKLPRTIIIAAMGNSRRKAVGLRERPNEMVRSGLGCRVGGIRAIRRMLIERSAFSKRAINLVSGDMMEMDMRKFSNRFEKRDRPHYIRLKKRAGGENAPIDMRFRGEMDDGVNLFFFQDLFDQHLVIDVGLNEAITRM